MKQKIFPLLVIFTFAACNGDVDEPDADDVLQDESVVLSSTIVARRDGAGISRLRTRSRTPEATAAPAREPPTSWSRPCSAGPARGRAST